MRCLGFLWLASILSGIPSHGLSAQTGGTDLSLDDLLNLTVSSASKYAQKSSDAPANITIITAEDIERYGFRTLAEAVRTLTSFSTSTDHSYTYTGVRGFARPASYNNRILVLLDGYPNNENVLGAGEIGAVRNVDVTDVERIEVVRGPGSSLYGARAMFAVVNVVTKKGSAIEGTRGWGEVGSYGRRMAGLQYGRLFDNGVDVSASGGWAERDGEGFYLPEYDNPEANFGLAQGLNWEELLRGRLAVRKGDWGLWGGAYDRDAGFSMAPHGSVFNDPRGRTEEKSWILGLEFDKEISVPLSVFSRVFAKNFEVHHVYPQPGNLVDINLAGRWIGSEARVRWDLGPNHRLVAGAELERTFTAEWVMDDEVGLALFDGNYPYSVGSVFLQDEFQMTEELAFTFGFRHDRYSTGLNPTTPRIAVVYHPWEESTVKLLWGNAFRAPNIYELNFESDYASHLANPGLASERIRSAEIVLEQRLAGGFAARVALFRNDVSNLIDQAPVARPEGWLPSPTGLPFALRFENGAKVRAEGVELDLNAAITDGFLGYLRYALQRAEEESTGTQAPNYPAHSVKAGGTQRIGGWVNIGASYLWESGRLTLAGPETDAHSVLDATVSSQPILDHLTFSLSGRNLLDTEYFLPSGPQHALISIPQGSRSFSLRVGVLW